MRAAQLINLLSCGYRITASAMGKTSRKTEAVATEAAARSKRARKAPAVADDLEQQQVQHVTEPSAGRRRATKNHSASTEAPAATAGTARKPARSKAATAAAAAQQADEEAQPEPYTKAGKGPKATAAAAAKKPAAKRKASAPAAAKEKPPYYLVKSEPDEFSIDALKARPNQTEGWEGVRNYVARNHLRAMKVGDKAFFYHSSCKVPGIVGIVEVVREAYPDLTAQDKGSKYFDPKATPEDPRWSMVDFKLVRELRRQITLDELKGHKEGALSGMALFTTARLSVQPVSKEEWEFVLALEDQGAEGSSDS